MKENTVVLKSVVADWRSTATTPKTDNDAARAFVQNRRFAHAGSTDVSSGSHCVITLGTSVLDICLQAKVEPNGSGDLHVDIAGTRFPVRCVGTPPAWGEKGQAAVDLSIFAALAEARILAGGGLTHSARQLAIYKRDKQLDVRIIAIDTNDASSAVAAELAQAGAEYKSLGLAPAAVNLVLTSADIPPRRLVLRSPAVLQSALDDKFMVIDQLLGRDAISLLLNSPKSVEVARYAVVRAKTIGVRIYTVLTQSLPMQFRLERVLSSGEVCVCNLGEFAEIAAALGVYCPLDETPAHLLALVKAISEIVRATPCGDICVTLGELGCVIVDSTTGSICHVGLTPIARARVRASIKPELINGSGDRFFAVFAVEHARLQHSQIENSCMLNASRLACTEVVRNYSPKLHPDRDWFDVRILSVGCDR